MSWKRKENSKGEGEEWEFIKFDGVITICKIQSEQINIFFKFPEMEAKYSFH